MNPHVTKFLERMLPAKEVTLDELVHAALVTRPDLSYRALQQALGVSRSAIQACAKRHGIKRK